MRGSVRYRCGSWHYRIDLGTLGGKRQQKEKGGFHTKSEADGELAKVLAVYYDTGTYLQNTKKTFEEVYLEFIEKECPSTREYATIVKYKSIYANHCLESFAPFPMYTISTKKIQEYVFGWAKLYSYDFAMSMYHFIFGLFAFAKRKNYMKVNPMLDVVSPKKPRGYEEVKFYTLGELTTMNEVFKNCSQFVAYMLGIHLGVRISECYALRWSDINWKNHTIRIDKQIQRQDGRWTFTPPKTDNSYRTITFGKTLENFLRTYRAQKEAAFQKTHTFKQVKYNEIRDVRIPHKCVELQVSDFIIVKDSGEVYPSTNAKALTRIAAQHNIAFKFHHLRHTHATVLASNKLSPKYVMERLGHAKVETTLRYYIHVTDEMQEKAIEIIDDVIGGLGENEYEYKQEGFSSDGNIVQFPADGCPLSGSASF